MKILIVNEIIQDEPNNGTALATANLISYLKSRGDEVRVLCANKNKNGEEGFYVVKKLNVLMFNSYVEKNGVVLATADKEIINEALDFAEYVHIMIPLHLGAKVAEMAYERGLPITAGFHMQAENLSSHVFMQNSKKFNKAVYKHIYNHVFKYCDAIHYPTKFIQDVFESNIKKKTNGYVISNGINKYVVKKEIKRPEYFENKILILSTGRFTKEKDQLTLIKAINKSKFKNDILLILAGQGPLEKKYKKYADKYKINHIFKFYNREEVVDIINMVDLYVHPALMELEGIAALEAMCVGKATLVSDSALAAPKLYAVSDDCIFKHKNYKDLALKMDLLLCDKNKLKKIEEMYYNNRVGFDQSKCMEKMGKMIDEVYKNHKAKGDKQ